MPDALGRGLFAAAASALFALAPPAAAGKGTWDVVNTNATPAPLALAADDIACASGGLPGYLLHAGLGTGALVMLFVVAMYLPIFKLAATV